MNSLNRSLGYPATTLRMEATWTKLITAVLFLTLIVGCKDDEKIRQEAYDAGFEAGQQTKYSELANKYYGNSELFVLNNNPHTINIDAKTVVRKLGTNSENVFNDIVEEVNLDILKGAASKLSLSPAQSTRAIEIYTQNHPKIANGYYLEYQNLCNSKSLNRNLGSFVDFTYYDRTDALTTVMSNQLCSTIGLVIGLVQLEFPASNIAGILAGQPCVELSNALLKPFTNKLLECGFIEDLETSHLEIERKASEMIMELASFEKQYQTKVSVTREEKVFFGLFSSKANAQAHYNGIVKAGFNLSEKMVLSVDYASRKIVLTLGQPKIFEPIIFPNLELMENGWFATIDVNTINGMQMKATNQIIRQAESDNILREAEISATSFLKMMFEPLASIPPVPFEVVVLSGNSNDEIRIPSSIN